MPRSVDAVTWVGSPCPHEHHGTSQDYGFPRCHRAPAALRMVRGKKVVNIFLIGLVGFAGLVAIT